MGRKQVPKAPASGGVGATGCATVSASFLGETCGFVFGENGLGLDWQSRLVMMESLEGWVFERMSQSRTTCFFCSDRLEPG